MRIAEEFEYRVQNALPDGRLLLCVSGGADSVALLHACVRAGRECVVAHCNFHLRGRESERDCRFVRWVCRCLGVALHVADFDVDAYMEARGLSLEMACRELRYEWFGHLREELGCSRIVVAHNADDDAETMFLNLFRGTGLRGLCGMDIDNGVIARPLLGVSRKDIECYLQSIGARHIVDSSNMSSDFRRNFIRNELLPAIETRWPGVRKALARTRMNLGDALKICDAEVSVRLDGKSDFLPVEALSGCAAPAMVLHGFLQGHGVSDTQVRDMVRSLRPGARWHLRDCDAVMCADGLHLLASGADISAPVAECVVLPMTDSLKAEAESNRDHYILYMDACGEDIEWRRPEKGERMSPLGMSGTKLVSGIVREAKLGPSERSALMLLAERSGRVLWIPGVKRSSHRLLSDHTKSVIRIVIKKN